MLKLMRQSATSGIMKFVVFGMLMAGAVGLALTGGYGFFRDGLGGSTAVATIGNTRVDITQFDQVVRRATSQQGIDTATAFQAGVIGQLLDEQVDTILLNKSAHDLGLSAGDAVLRDKIKEMVAPYAQDGVSPRQTLRTILRAQNMSEGQFIDAVRSETSTGLLRNALQDGAGVIPDNEASDLAQYANEKRTVEYVYLPDAAVKDYKTPDDAVLKPFYQAGVERYAVPETRTFDVAVLSAQSLASTLTVSDDDLHKAYDDQKDTLGLPERRTLDQAILPDEKSAQAVAAAVKGGQKLKDAVKSITGNIKAYTGSETYQRAGLDKTIADPAFTAPGGGVAGPVHTALGWHVLVVQAITAPQIPPFDSVKDKLRTMALNDKAGEAMYTTSTQLDDDLAGGGDLAGAVKKFHLDLTKIGPVGANGNGADGKPALKDFGKDAGLLLKTAFGLNQGETSPVVSLSDGRYAVVHMDTIVPKSYKPFDAVKPDLAKLWISDQQNVLNKQHAQDALAKLEAGNENLSALATESGGTVKTLSLTRLTPAPNPLQEQAKIDLFKADRGAFIKTTGKNGIVIARVTAVTVPDAATLPADQLKTIRQGTVQAAQEEILQTYLTDLRGKYKVTINNDLLQKTYGKKDTGADNNNGNGPGDGQ